MGLRQFDVMGLPSRCSLPSAGVRYLPSASPRKGIAAPALKAAGQKQAAIQRRRHQRLRCDPSCGLSPVKSSGSSLPVTPPILGECAKIQSALGWGCSQTFWEGPRNRCRDTGVPRVSAAALGTHVKCAAAPDSRERRVSASGPSRLGRPGRRSG